MSATNVPPGSDAHIAFRLGMISAGVLGLAALAFSFWFEVLSLLHVGYTLVVLFPVYLVFVASALSVWTETRLTCGPSTGRRSRRSGAVRVAVSSLTSSTTGCRWPPRAKG